MPDHFPTPYCLEDQIVEEDSEFLLYRFHSWLGSLSMDIKLRHLGRPRDLEKAMRYLEARDPARARLMRGALQLMGSLLDEATELLNDAIHWPTIEAIYCPSEDDFIDTPGQWLAQGQGQEPQPCPQNAARNIPIEVPAAVETVPVEAAPVAASPVEPTAPASLEKPRRRGSASSLRSLGRELRTECEYEKRRFYAIAGKHELPTDPSAAPAIRRALSDLLGEPIASRKQLTARQWALAASAIETEDLYWEGTKSKTAPQNAAVRP